MKAHWMLMTDNIMEQYELAPLLQSQTLTCIMRILSSEEILSINEPTILLVNLRAESLQIFDFFQTLKDVDFPSHVSVIAYSDMKHDHEFIHKAKSMGIKYICTKDQLKDLLLMSERSTVNL